MTEINYKVRNLTKEEVPKALDIWRETGMHQGTYSLYTFLEVDPGCFQIAGTDEGEVVGACAAVVHHPDLAFIGMYCVRKKYRGRGIGITVWNACLERAGSRNASLFAVPGKELYRDRGGFPIVETDWVGVMNDTTEAVKPENLSDTPPKGVVIEAFAESHLPLMYHYDESIAGYDRKKLLELTCKEQDSRTFVALSEGICVGFGTIKMSCQAAGQIGPLYADSKEIAEVLLRNLLLSLPQAKGFSMLTANTNKAANEFVKIIECPVLGNADRMYRVKKLDVDISKIYGFLDLNLSPY